MYLVNRKNYFKLIQLEHNKLNTLFVLYYITKQFKTMSYDTETKKALAKAVVTLVNTQKELRTKVEACLKKAQYFENVGNKNAFIEASHEAQFLNMECFVTFARTTGAIAQYASVMGANHIMN